MFSRKTGPRNREMAKPLDPVVFEFALEISPASFATMPRVINENVGCSAFIGHPWESSFVTADMEGLTKFLGDGIGTGNHRRQIHNLELFVAS